MCSVCFVLQNVVKYIFIIKILMFIRFFLLMLQFPHIVFFSLNYFLYLLFLNSPFIIFIITKFSILVLEIKLKFVVISYKFLCCYWHYKYTNKILSVIYYQQYLRDISCAGIKYEQVTSIVPFELLQFYFYSLCLTVECV